MPSKWDDLGINWLAPPNDNTVLISAGMIELIKSAIDRAPVTTPVYDPILCNDIRYAISRFNVYAFRCMRFYRDLGYNLEGTIDPTAAASRQWSDTSKQATGIIQGYERLQSYLSEDLTLVPGIITLMNPLN